MPVRLRSSALLFTVLLALFLFMSLQRPATLADDAAEPLTPIVGEAVGFAISPPVSELQDEQPPPADTEGEEPADLKMDFRDPAADAGEGSIDGAIFPAPPESGL